MYERIVESPGQWGYPNVQIVVRVEPDVNSNTSTVTITDIRLKGSMWAGPGLANAARINGNINIDGMRAVTIVDDNFKQCRALLTEDKWMSATGYTGATNGFSSVPIVVTHDTLGDRSVEIYIDVTFQLTTGTSAGGQKEKHELELDTLPRASDISLPSGGVLGNAMTITLTRAVSSFTDTITYECGSKSGTIITNTSNTSVSWTPGIDLASQGTDSEYVRISITTKTYSGGNYIGSKTAVIDCHIPDSIKPVISSKTISDKNGYLTKYGKYVQNKSVVRVSVTHSGSQGSTVKSVSVSIDGGASKTVSAGATNTVVELTPTTVGVKTVTIKVTDSRNRVAQSDGQITIAGYSSPTIELHRVQRCDETGSLQADGERARVVFSGDVSSISTDAGYSNNTPVYAVKIRQKGSTAWSTPITITTVPDGEKFHPRNAAFVFYANREETYDCCLTVYDDFNQSGIDSIYMTIPVAFALMDFSKNDRAIGFGQRASVENTLSIGLDMKMFDHRITSLATPVEGTDAATKAYVDEKIAELLRTLQGQ